MFSYSKILQNAYHLTKRRPLLWLFGMFLIGSFNLNFLQVRGLLPDFHFSDFNNVPAWFWYLEQHPGRLGLASVSLLVLALTSLILTNWSKVMLLLIAQADLDKRYVELAAEAKQSRKFLWQVIQVSVFTSMFMLGALAVLVAPIFVDNPALQTALWILGAVIFLLIVFTVSSINIFTTMFIVVLKLSVKKALDAATDFFVANWTSLLGLVAILLVMYLAGFGLGSGLLGLIKIFGQISLLNLGGQGALQFSLVFSIIKALGALLLWVWLGMLNAFLNITLLLFFLQKITPTKAEEKKEFTEIAPAPLAP